MDHRVFRVHVNSDLGQLMVFGQGVFRAMCLAAGSRVPRVGDPASVCGCGVFRGASQPAHPLRAGACFDLLPGWSAGAGFRGHSAASPLRKSDAKKTAGNLAAVRKLPAVFLAADLPPGASGCCPRNPAPERNEWAGRLFVRVLFVSSAPRRLRVLRCTHRKICGARYSGMAPQKKIRSCCTQHDALPPSGMRFGSGTPPQTA